MDEGLDAGIALVDTLASHAELAEYLPAHAARADLCRRAGRLGDAAVSYRRALALVKQEPERRFLARRLAECG